jgi:hypothetical protein
MEESDTDCGTCELKGFCGAVNGETPLRLEERLIIDSQLRLKIALFIPWVVLTWILWAAPAGGWVAILLGVVSAAVWALLVNWIVPTRIWGIKLVAVIGDEELTLDTVRF